MTIDALRDRLRQIAPVVRRIIGAPDYDAYLLHAAEYHPDRPVLSRDDFVAMRLADRYSQPGNRCC